MLFFDSRLCQTDIRRFKCDVTCQWYVLLYIQYIHVSLELSVNVTVIAVSFQQFRAVHWSHRLLKLTEAHKQLCLMTFVVILVSSDTNSSYMPVSHGHAAVNDIMNEWWDSTICTHLFFCTQYTLTTAVRPVSTVVMIQLPLETEFTGWKHFTSKVTAIETWSIYLSTFTKLFSNTDWLVVAYRPSVTDWGDGTSADHTTGPFIRNFKSYSTMLTRIICYKRHHFHKSSYRTRWCDIDLYSFSSHLLLLLSWRAHSHLLCINPSEHTVLLNLYQVVHLR